MIPELTSFATRLRESMASSRGASVPALSSESHFNPLALELFALQFAHNAAYRTLCEARGVKPATVGHWTRIPAVPAAAFKELELTCLAPGERTAVFRSSGTTGQRPSRHFHCAESLALYEASLWPWFQQHVLAGLGADGWQLAMLTPPPVAAPHSSLVHMFETVRRKSGAGDGAFLGDVGVEGAWMLDFARAEAVIGAALTQGQPLVLLGTAFNFVHLLDGLIERGLRWKLPPGSVAMETGGYKGRSRELPKAELHQLITDRLGLPATHIVCEYGMSEISSQAYEAGAGDGKSSRHTSHVTRHFVFPPWARVRIVSPETGDAVSEGETGLVRIWDLANAFSVMAVQTEDLAVRRGDGFELIGRAAAAEARGCSLMPR